MPASSRLSIGVHALVMLDDPEAGPVTSTEIAGSVNTNPVVIRRVLARLAQAGLVAGGTGAAGGYRLARPATEITLWDVYQALREEGPFALHPRAPNARCPVGRQILPHLLDVYGAAESAMKQVLGTTTARCARSCLRPAELRPGPRASLFR
jgi:Rrf2 family protein